MNKTIEIDIQLTDTQDLSDHERATFNALMAFVDEPYPQIEIVARKAKLTNDQCRVAIRNLINAGHVTREFVSLRANECPRGKGGKYNLYGIRIFDGQGLSYTLASMGATSLKVETIKELRAARPKKPEQT